MTEGTAKFSIEADPTPYEAAMARCIEVTTSAVSEIKERFASINEAIGMLGEAFAGLTAAFAGGEALKEFVDTAVNVGFGAEEMGRMFGIGATAASQLKVALGDAFLTQDQYQEAAGRLTKQLATNENAFTRLGIATRNADGSFKSINDIILEVNDRLSQLKEGTDRNVAAAELYGKGWEQSADIMRFTSGVMDEAKSKADSLGLTIGEESVARVDAYKTAMNDVHDVIEGMENAIGQTLMPVLTAAGQWFSSIGPEAVEATRAAIDALVTAFEALWDVTAEIVQDVIDVLVDLGNMVLGAFGSDSSSISALEFFENVLRLVEVAATSLKNGFTLLTEIITGEIEGLIDELELLRQVAADAFELKWGRIQADWNAGMQKIEDDAMRHVTNIVNASVDAANKINDELTKSFGTPKEKEVKPSKDGGNNDSNRGSVMTQLEAELEMKEAAWSQENAAHGQFIDFSKQQELEFWQSKLATVNQGTTEYVEIQNKIGALTVQVAKENFQKQLAQLKEEEDAAQEDYAKKLQFAQEYAEKVGAAYGQDSKEYEAAQEQILSIEKKMADQRKAIALEAAKTNDQIALNDVDSQLRAAQQQVASGTETKAELLRQEIDFENQKFAIKQAALQRDLSLEDNPTNVAKLYDQLEVLEQQHQDALSTIQRQATLERDKMWQDSAKKMEESFNSAIMKMIDGTRTFVQTIRSLVQGVVNSLINMALQMAEQWVAKEVMKLVASKATAAGQVQAQAGVAGASGVASFAGAPWPLDLGAPAFGAAMLGAAESYGSVASAAGGYDIPAGVNPLVQAHEREMILPEDIADPLRDMTGGRGNTHLHVNISAIDPSSFHDYIHSHAAQNALIESLSRAHSRGRRRS